MNQSLLSAEQVWASMHLAAGRDVSSVAKGTEERRAVGKVMRGALQRCPDSTLKALVFPHL